MVNLYNIRLLSPEIILVMVALMLLLLDLMVRRKEIIAYAGLAGVFISAYVNFRLVALGWSDTSLVGMFMFDGYANFFKLIFYI
ncbi:MAG TPA: hypothetical protein ENH31_06400, partial [Nitrospirae bacterium]|nr:hypothetical protein [Nitrospirota bacterium]